MGESPTTSWRYWVRKNVEPANPKQVSRLAVMATRNFGTANRVMSIMGTGSRRWRRMKAQPATRPTRTGGTTTKAQPRSATVFMP